MKNCFFCQNSGGEILFNNKLFRIILIADENYLGYLRIVANSHLKELTDLADSDNLAMYQAVLQCEKILRQIFNPDKINIASFGNVTPHIHWHIIPRFANDKHYPNPIWGDVTNSHYQPSTQLQQLALNLVQEFKTLFTV